MIKPKIELLRQLVQKSAALRDEEWEEGGFGVAGGVGRSICTAVPHELDSVQDNEEEMMCRARLT
jgi:hypothetical protein